MLMFTTGIAPNNSLILLFWSTENLPDREGRNVARLVLSYLREIESLSEVIRDVHSGTSEDRFNVESVPLEREQERIREEKQFKLITDGKSEKEQSRRVKRKLEEEDFTYLYNTEVVKTPDVSYIGSSSNEDQEVSELLITEEERQEVEEQRKNVENLEAKMDSEEASGESCEGDESRSSSLEEASDEILIPTAIAPPKTPSKFRPAVVELEYVDSLGEMSTPLSHSRSPTNSIFSNYEWNGLQDDSLPTGNFTFSLKDLNIEILAKLKDSKKVKEKAELYEQLISTEKEAIQLSNKKYIRATRMHTAPNKIHSFPGSPSPRRENKLNISAIYLEQISENSVVSPVDRNRESILRTGKRRLSENRFLLRDQRSRSHHQDIL